MLSKELKSKIISLYYSDTPVSQRKIAHKLGISYKTVRYWIEKHQNTKSSLFEQIDKDEPQKFINPEKQRRENNRQYMQSRRLNSNFRAREAESKRQNRKRAKLDNVSNGRNKRQKIESDVESSCVQPEFHVLADNFFKAVSEGPIHACYCCDRLFFKSSMRSLSKKTVRDKGLQENLARLVFYKDVGEIGQFCKTCYDSLVRGKIPPLAIGNGLEFPEIPDCLRDLNPVEERLLSPRIYFGQIYPDCRNNLTDSVINIPVDSNTTVNKLPRNLDEVYVFLTKNSTRVAETIRPERVFRAARYLIRQEPYGAFGINLSEDWYETFRNGDVTDSKILTKFESTHTLISNERSLGKNQTSSLLDECAEELTFPTIYCGRARRFKTKLSYSQIANSEIRRSDRRAARPDHVLWAYSKLNNLRLGNATQTSVRQKKMSSLTAENLLDKSFVENLIGCNEGYKCVQPITSSQAHWEKEKKRLFAAIRQWGIPTLFVTLSAAETHWFELMQALSLNVDRHILTKEEFENSNFFTFDKKRQLVRDDPVTCALYFEHRFREIVKTWQSRHGAFEEYNVKHSYYRIKFQHRGSPRVHMLLWLENAPALENIPECEKFVDKLMTCSENNLLIDYQVHHHTSTCLNECQIPYFPMDRTRILKPLKDSRCNLKEEFKALRDHLRNLDWRNNKMSFQEFLNFFNLAYDRYIAILRSGINKPTVFLKRRVSEITINNYSPKIFNLMKSHMDIQFVTTPYACAAHLMTDKPRKCELLKKCVEDCRSKNANFFEEIHDTFINGTEISSQEAAWSILGLPMSKLSVDDIFVPTFPPRDRDGWVKNKATLNRLPKDSTDIFQWSIIDKYVKRPTNCETLCLADFATGYDFKKEGRAEDKLIDRHLYAKERKIRKILRSVNYKLDDEENYYREQVTLYTHWRNEEEDILNKNFKILYKENLYTIQLNSRKYNNLDVDLEERCETSSVKDKGSQNGDSFESEDEIQTELDIEKEFSKFKTTGRWAEHVYRNSIQKANIQQFDLLKHVMFLEFYNKLPYKLFISGPAGCGKSHAIGILEQTLMRWYDSAEITVLKVAPTGKAAFNIQGQTLHSAFALPLKAQTLARLSPRKENEYRATYKNLKTIIIDEISMMSHTQLCFVDRRMRQITGKDAPFGNLNVICFGDFRQLLPVGALPVYRIPGATEENTLWKSFQFYEFTEIMRQKDDMEFALCLNRVADGTMTEQDIALVQSRVVTDSDKIPSSPIHLFHSNAAVDKHNSFKIASLETRAYIIKARDRVSGKGNDAVKKDMLRRAQKLPKSQTNNLDYEITVKVGARLSLACNLSTADGLVNGAMGILKKVELGGIKNSDMVQALWIEFDNKEIGTRSRQRRVKYRARRGIDSRWTPITRLKRVIHGKKNSALSVCREQFPVTVSEALTIHKSQGATFDECVVHVEKKMKRNLLYVALSRVTRAEGLYVVGEFEPPEPPSKYDPLAIELQRLRKSSLIPAYQFLHERDDFAGIQFIFHNVQGLTTHHEDLLADPCFTQSDIIMLVETHSIPTDNFQIPGFEVAGAIDSNGREETRENRGVMTYMKDKLIDRSEEIVIMDGPTVQILITYILENVRFAVCYANPRSTAEEIVLKIRKIMTYDKDRKTVLVGEFNVDFNSRQGQNFIKELRVVGLEIRTNPKHYTTRGRTTIDAIFSNKGMRTGVYMTAYSYHMALYGRID